MNRYTHLGVYGVLIDHRQILLVRKGRGPHTGKWDLPGGSIEFGEDPHETLQREFLEETGLTGITGRIKDALSYTLIYSYREQELEELHHIGIIYDVESDRKDMKIKMDGDGQDSLGARWIPLEQLKDMSVTPFVEQILLKITNKIFL